MLDSGCEAREGVLAAGGRGDGGGQAVFGRVVDDAQISRHEWLVARRYLSRESLELVLVEEPTAQEVAQLTPA